MPTKHGRIHFGLEHVGSSTTMATVVDLPELSNDDWNPVHAVTTSETSDIARFVKVRIST